MDNHEQKQSVCEDVLATIKQGKVTMRPRWQFVLFGVLFVVGGIMIALTLLYLVSFIIFILRQTGVGSVTSFGPRGWYTFMVSLPWMLIGFAALFMIILEVLVRRYAFAYRRPLVYSVVTIMGVVVAGGFFVAATPLHHSLFISAQQHHFPLGEPLYRHFGEQEFSNIIRGRVIATTTEGFIVNNRMGMPLQIFVASTTQLPYGHEFMPGQMVVIFGDRSSTTVQAIGVRTIGE